MPHTLSTLKKFFLLLAMQPVIMFTAMGQPAQPAQQPVMQYSPGGMLDAVYDHFGNSYSLGQVAINNEIRKAAGGPATIMAARGANSIPVTGGGHGYAATTPAGCSSGYFQLYLEAGCGMENPSDPVHAARLAVVCQVLNDISNFFPSPCTATGQKINIWVQSPGGGAGFLGVATPFFSLPYAPATSGITDNMIWITLNSGKDAWTNVTPPVYLSGIAASFFHGSMAFQFNGSVIWHTDLTTPTPAGKYDLYTVVLHEMMHAMGFHTLINYNGLPVFNTGFNYFSRYDLSLKTSAGASLLTNTGPCSLYGQAFNAALTPAAVLSPGATAATCPSGYQTGPSVDHTACASAVHFVNGTLDVPVYTPSCFERGSSLSHFEDECWAPAPLTVPASNNHYFVMSNKGLPGPYAAGAPGAMKRFLSAEERLAMCALGYKANATWGSAANLNLKSYTGGVCSGLGVAGVNDGFSAGAYTYFSAGGAPVTITSASLTANDYGAAQATCLQVVNGTGTITGSGPYTYTPGTGEYGVVLLRYLPVSTTGSVGNITYVFLFVGSTACTGTPCDIAVNGGIEQAHSCGDMASIPGIAHCWDTYCGSTDLYTLGCGSMFGQYDIPYNTTIIPTNVHPCSPTTNKHFVGMGVSNNNGGPNWSEGMQAALASELVAGQEYIISCWAKTGHFSLSGFPFIANHMEFALSPSASPLAFIGQQVPSLPTGLTLLWDLLLPVDYGDDWHYFEKRFTYTGGPARRLVIFNAQYLNGYTAGFYSAKNFIDDISIKPVTSACIFTPPSFCSGGLSTVDLSPYVTMTGGTFRWPGMPVTAGVPTTYTTPAFDATSAYNASMAIGGNGLIPVSYTYTNPIGCEETVYANIWISSTSVPAITGDTSLAIGESQALASVLYGGTWSSSTPSVATVNAMTGYVTGIALGSSTITYSAGAGCENTRVVTVHMPVSVTDVAAGAPAISLFPNPTTGQLSVMATLAGGDDVAGIDVTDITGRTLLAEAVAAQNGMVRKNILLPATLANGIYMVRLRTTAGNVVARFVLSR